MDAETRAWIERRFAVPPSERSKVVALDEAVATHVRPGDTVHLGMTHARGSAAWWEMIRRFRGTDPGFTLAAVQMTSPLSPMVHAGLARTIITSWAGDSYWSPGPNPVYQRAWASGVEFEQWSILTFVQRLAAAARGHTDALTRSLAGSDMMRNAGVRETGGGDVSIPALVPDVSIFHAPAADASGNVLFSPPLFENVYGALAARRGCIVTVERVVEPDVIRAQGHMTQLPANRVLAVVEAPFGAHPGGLLPSGIDGVDGYGEDYEFWTDIRRAARDPASMDAWIDEWVMEPGRYESTVAERIGTLRGRTRGEPLLDLDRALSEIEIDAQPNALEIAIVAAARELGARIERCSYDSMLAGAGMANLAAWLAAYDLAERGRSVDLVAEMGLVGYWPRPGEPILFNQRNFPTCTMLTDIDHALGILIGGGRARSIGALGAAQVDRCGNINSTQTDDRLLMGSGGANDVVTCATESVVVCAQSKDRFPERVSYVTGPGARVHTVVSTLGIYRKDHNDELVLTEVFDADVPRATKECTERCGWPLNVARDVRVVEPPTREELRTLRVLDPRGWFRT